MATCRHARSSALWSLAVVVAPFAVEGIHRDFIRRELSDVATSREAKHALKALQWNVHGQCFEKCSEADSVHCDHAYPACQNGVLEKVTSFLKDESYDFIGLELFTDRSLFTSGEGVMSGWTHLEHPCGGAAGYGVFPFDVARLIFNSRRWEAVGSPLGGCFEKSAAGWANKAAVVNTSTAENDYRAFVVQALRRKGTSDTVTVAVAHFPHPESTGFDDKIRLLKDAVARVGAAAEAPRTLLIADTNHGAPAAPRAVAPLSSLQVVHYLSNLLKEATSTDLSADTCCFSASGDGYYGGSVDRVIAVNFTQANMVTEHPFEGHVPFAARDMHDPIVGVLTYELADIADAKSSSPRTMAPLGGATIAALAGSWLGRPLS